MSEYASDAMWYFVSDEPPNLVFCKTLPLAAELEASPCWPKVLKIRRQRRSALERLGGKFDAAITKASAKRRAEMESA